MTNRDRLLQRLEALGFDTTQCDDMPDDRLASWVDECEMIAFRDRTGYLPPDSSDAEDAHFDPAGMNDAYEIARKLIETYGDKADGIVLKRVVALSAQGDKAALRQCGEILQALRDLAAAKKPLH